MNLSDRSAASSRDPLADFPLGADAGVPAVPAAAPPAPAAETSEPVAPLSGRALAFAADLAGTSLAVTLALMAAVAVIGKAPRPSGLPWAAAFGVVFSFVFVALPLALFGRTVGMSLAGIAAAPGPAGRGLTPSEAARRWAGTAATALTFGLALITTVRDPLRPTPADRMSGRALVRESAD